MIQKIAIYGAGAIGGWMGVRLAASGCDVSVVARGDTLAAVRAHGLRLREGEAERAQAVTASDNTAALGVQDLVIVSVKAPGMADVARRIQPLIGPNTIVLTAMNGVPWWFLQGFGGPVAGLTLQSVDPGGAIAQAIPAQHVIGCVVHASCSVDAPGVIRHRAGQGLIVGEPAGGETARVRELADLLTKAGFDVTLSPQIQKDVWYKLWGNMTMNPVCAMTGASSDRVLDDELVRGFLSAVMLEAKEIGARNAPVDAAGCGSRQAGGARCPGRLGARAGPAHAGAHAVHRCAAGPEPAACASAGFVSGSGMTASTSPALLPLPPAGEGGGEGRFSLPRWGRAGVGADRPHRRHAARPSPQPPDQVRGRLSPQRGEGARPLGRAVPGAGARP